MKKRLVNLSAKVKRRARRSALRIIDRLAVRRRTFDAAAVEQFVFGQQHVGTQNFFSELCGQPHTVPATAFPHTRFLQDPHREGRALFDRYLTDSWAYLRPQHNTPQAREEHMNAFLARLGGVGGLEPIKLSQRPDGRYVVVDGNHRVGLAVAQGRGVDAVVIPEQATLRTLTTVPTVFFGSGNREMPYQSIFRDGREIVRGRRRDTLDRMRKVIQADLVGRTVLDLGCNFGASSFLAAEFGAGRVIGLEVEPAIVTQAIRLNTFMVKPCHFDVCDLNVPYGNNVPIDTIFAFSVAAWVQNHDALAQTIKNSGASVMYFECHNGTTEKDYPLLLNSEIVSSSELIGVNESGQPGVPAGRPFFRCELRQS